MRQPKFRPVPQLEVGDLSEHNLILQELNRQIGEASRNIAEIETKLFDQPLDLQGNSITNVSRVEVNDAPEILDSGAIMPRVPDIDTGTAAVTDAINEDLNTAINSALVIVFNRLSLLESAVRDGGLAK